MGVAAICALVAREVPRREAERAHRLTCRGRNHARGTRARTSYRHLLLDEAHSLMLRRLVKCLIIVELLRVAYQHLLTKDNLCFLVAEWTFVIVVYSRP